LFFQGRNVAASIRLAMETGECVAFKELFIVFDRSQLCGFPHIQMLSKRLLFVLKPVEKKVSILNLALSMRSRD